MLTSAIIFAFTWLFPNLRQLSSARINGSTVLELVVESVEKSGVVEEICILTDDETMAERHPEIDTRFCFIPDQFKGHTFNHLDIELSHLYREYDMILAADVPGTQTFFLPWNLPLLGSRNVEKMFHTLLDDPLTAKLIPTLPVDPQLFNKTGENDYFMVWGQKGLDRQLVPQPYRPSTACFTHWDRTFKTIPKLTGMPMDAISLFEIREESDVELANYLYEYQKEND